MNVGPTGGRPVDLSAAEASASQAATPAAAAHASVPASWLESFHAGKAELFQGREGQTVKLEGPIGKELGATLTFSNFGRGGAPGKPTFTIATTGGIPPHAQPAQPMTKAQEKALLQALEKQLATHWKGQP
ncbi:MAG TPA: hypothetical protein VHF22_02270, partial [Planctomycetota bacterium]|nr:hypothetical protein [Planctomycetota bacterium]